MCDNDEGALEIMPWGTDNNIQDDISFDIAYHRLCDHQINIFLDSAIYLSSSTKYIEMISNNLIRYKMERC